MLSVTEPTVAAGYAGGLLAFAVANGARRNALLKASGIASQDLRDHDNRIALDRYVALMNAAKRMSDDPALALHFGERFEVFGNSIVGLLGRACATLADAFAQLNRYSRLIMEVNLGNVERFQLMRRRGELWLVDTRLHPNDFPDLTETSFARMVCAAHHLGTPQFVKAVHVTHPSPPYWREYDRIFHVPIRFNSNDNALLTDEAWMNHRLAGNAPMRLPSYVFGVFSAHASSLLRRLESSKTVRGRVQSLLMPILHTGEASIALVASRLRISRQTLYRQLRSEGVTFEQVHDELRHQLALHYLLSKKVSVTQTAFLLGFSETASFSRAFKRWTGTRPSARLRPAAF